MATALRLRRGTTTQHGSFTGLEGEVTVDTTKDTVVVHDGSTAGGFPLAKETGSTVAVANGTVSAPGLTTSGDTNTGIFFPAADTIAFAEGGAEAMRINSSGNVGIGATPTNRFHVADNSASAMIYGLQSGAGDIIALSSGASEKFRITNAGNVGIGTSSPAYQLDINNASSYSTIGLRQGGTLYGFIEGGSSQVKWGTNAAIPMLFEINGTERARITGAGDLCVGTTATAGSSRAIISGNTRQLALSDGTYNWYQVIGNNFWSIQSGEGTERARITSAGHFLVGTTTVSVSDTVNGFTGNADGSMQAYRASGTVGYFSRNTDDGTIISLRQANVEEGTISVSGTTVSYNAFAGSHWSQLQEGRGYNPEILRGTVMSSIGEMCEWKSVTWTETIEHPAVPAVEAKEAVLDEEGNVIEPAIEAVEVKDAWTETFNKREAYLGQLPIGATFEEDGVTKTVVDDGNERLPKVKISDVVGDKAVYGVFQTWDEVQDMLVTSLGAFVVRIAAGVTVQIGDLLESNGDGCAKVQDDDVIRNKTIGKVTSITPSATYADGSYTVPAVLYCG